MWIDLDAHNPVGHLDELIPGDPKVLLVQEEHGPLQVGATEEHVVECQEAVKGDALGIFSLELLGDSFDHLLFPLLGDGRGIEEMAAEVDLSHLCCRVFCVPGELHFQNIPDQKLNEMVIDGSS